MPSLSLCVLPRKIDDGDDELQVRRRAPYTDHQQDAHGEYLGCVCLFFARVPCELVRVECDLFVHAGFPREDVAVEPSARFHQVPGNPWERRMDLFKKRSQQHRINATWDTSRHLMFRLPSAAAAVAAADVALALLVVLLVAYLR